MPVRDPSPIGSDRKPQGKPTPPASAKSATGEGGRERKRRRCASNGGDRTAASRPLSRNRRRRPRRDRPQDGTGRLLLGMALLGATAFAAIALENRATRPRVEEGHRAGRPAPAGRRRRRAPGRAIQGRAGGPGEAGRRPEGDRRRQGVSRAASGGSPCGWTAVPTRPRERARARRWTGPRRGVGPRSCAPSWPPSPWPPGSPPRRRRWRGSRPRRCSTAPARTRWPRSIAGSPTPSSARATRSPSPIPRGRYALLNQARALAQGRGRPRRAPAGDGPRQPARRTTTRGRSRTSRRISRNTPRGPTGSPPGWNWGMPCWPPARPPQARLTWSDLARDLDGKDDDEDASTARVDALYRIPSTYGIPNPPDDAQLGLGVAALRRALDADPAHPKAVQAAFDIGASYQARGKAPEALAAFADFLDGQGVTRPRLDEARRRKADLDMAATYQERPAPAGAGEVRRGDRLLARLSGEVPRRPAVGRRPARHPRRPVARRRRARSRARSTTTARAAWKAFAAANPLDARVPARPLPGRRELRGRRRSSTTPSPPSRRSPASSPAPSPPPTPSSSRRHLRAAQGRPRPRPSSGSARWPTSQPWQCAGVAAGRRDGGQGAGRRDAQGVSARARPRSSGFRRGTSRP